MLIDHLVRFCDSGVSVGGLAWRRLSWRGPSSSPPSEGHCWLVVGDSPLHTKKRLWMHLHVYKPERADEAKQGGNEEKF
jgi:hypothetical protein